MGNRKAVSEELKIGESAITNLWSLETTSDSEMHYLTGDNVRRNMEKETEIEVTQALSLLELVAMGNAKPRILKNGNVRIVQEQAISQIEGAGKWKNFIARFRKCAKIENGKI